MKQILLILTISLAVLSCKQDQTSDGLFGAGEQTFKKDIKIYKPNAEINFASSTDATGVTISHSDKKLTITGDTINMSVTPRVAGVALNAIYASGNAVLGANSITMTGSIAATANRVTKGWFTNLEVTNLPTVAGSSIHTAPSFTTSITILVGDTTVAAAYGKVVFKTSDSTFYGCRYIRPTGKKKWFAL